MRDAAVIDALNALVAVHGRWGFWRLFDRLRAQGQTWNHKRVHRVYCALRLNLPRRTVRRVPKRVRQPLAAPHTLNHTWAMDLMSDTLYGGRRVRALTIIDEGNREALDVVVAASRPSVRVTRVLDALALVHGAPQAIRVDNGPEFLAQAFVEWCAGHGTAIHHIQPGKPDQNAYIERFNRTYRTEVLNANVFESLEELQALTDTWLRVYNEERPHDKPRAGAAPHVSAEASTRGRVSFRSICLTGELTPTRRSLCSAVLPIARQTCATGGWISRSSVLDGQRKEGDSRHKGRRASRPPQNAIALVADV